LAVFGIYGNTIRWWIMPGRLPQAFVRSLRLWRSSLILFWRNQPGTRVGHENLGTLFIIFILATLVLSAVGTLFSALTVQIRAREVMLPVLLLPLAVPVMIAAVEATRGTLNGDPYEFYSQWLHLLSIFDIIFTVVSFWLFEFILDS